MSRTRAAIFVFAALAALAGIGAAVAGSNGNFRALLSGDAENPPVETKGHGVATLKLSDGGDSLSYKLMVANLEDITQAHIHCGAPELNGPVVAFLFGPASAGVDDNGRLAEGVITDADVLPRPDSPECPGGVADLDDVIEKIESGDAYVNVHTIAHPAGEIRGQIE
jgi:hypothetical protein